MDDAEDDDSADAGEDGAVLQRLEEIGFPQSIGKWVDIQDQVWPDAPTLQPGWIRVWSRSQNSAYFMRTADQYTTFEIAEAAA